jgi:hypothetical protein
MIVHSIRITYPRFSLNSQLYQHYKNALRTKKSSKLLLFPFMYYSLETLQYLSFEKLGLQFLTLQINMNYKLWLSTWNFSQTKLERDGFTKTLT